MILFIVIKNKLFFHIVNMKIKRLVKPVYIFLYPLKESCCLHIKPGFHCVLKRLVFMEPLSAQSLLSFPEKMEII